MDLQGWAAAPAHRLPEESRGGTEFCETLPFRCPKAAAGSLTRRLSGPCAMAMPIPMSFSSIGHAAGGSLFHRFRSLGWAKVTIHTYTNVRRSAATSTEAPGPHAMSPAFPACQRGLEMLSLAKLGQSLDGKVTSPGPF